MVARAAALGMSALALTDHDAIYGAVRFVQAAKAQGIQPILGAELTLTDGSHLTLLVENETGWHNLCYLISRGRRNAPKGESALAPAELVGCTGGLIALSGCRKGEVAAALRRGEREVARQEARHYRELFGQGQFFIELQRHFLPGEERLIPRLTALASYLHLPMVATNNVHYVAQDGHRLQDVLVCIRHLTTWMNPWLCAA
ncbi:MAG: PHP domain-containing protein [Chloroflexi bacterium]|nr:PHP domain-containing protein [Chloroflexota bacterium]